MPTRDDYLTQIDADLVSQTEDEGVLRERRKLVKATKTDSAAGRAYTQHVADSQQEAIVLDDEGEVDA